LKALRVSETSSAISGVHQALGLATGDANGMASLAEENKKRKMKEEKKKQETKRDSSQLWNKGIEGDE